jgi:hypothetical protein
MSPKKRLSFVLTLCLFAAFAVPAAQAEEAGGICAMPDLGMLEPIPTSCVCVPGGSYDCSGTGASCSAAEGAFFADCDDEADVICTGLDGVCFVTIISQDPCVWNGSQYVVTGRARTRCRACS